MKYQVTDSHTESLLCYEFLYNQNALDIGSVYKGMIEDWKNLGQYELICTNIEALEEKNYGLYINLLPSIIESKSKLGKWDEISPNYTHFITQKDNIIYNNNQVVSNQFDMYLSLIFISIHKGDKSKTNLLINNCFKYITNCLSASIIESYNRSYENILELHILNEIYEYIQFKEQNLTDFHDLSSYWNDRYSIIIPQVNYKTKLLYTHRSLYGFNNCKDEILNCWLEVYHNLIYRNQININ